MSTTAAEAFRAEIAAAILLMEPRLEGLRDFHDLNITPSAHAVVDQAIAWCEHRQTLLMDMVDALDALATDGYPEIPESAVAAEIYDNLVEQLRTQTAALAHFTRLHPATSLGATIGAPEPK